MSRNEEFDAGSSAMAPTYLHDWTDDYGARMPRVTAIHPDTGAQMGFLVWDGEEGEIKHVRVRVGFRRKGVATGMWNEAHRIAATLAVAEPPHHSDDLTKDGAAWALSTRTPRGT